MIDLWKRGLRWLELRGILQHRHAWYLMAVWGRRDRDGRRATYFMIYRCARCECTDEQPTPLGVAWIQLKGKRRDGLTYIPSWG